MDFYGAFYLGGDIEFIKRIEDVLPIVKSRKKTKYLLLLDVLRRIVRNLMEFEINSDLQEETLSWISRLETKYRADQEIEEEDAEELSDDAANWEQMLWRVLSNRPVIELSQKGALNQKALLSITEGKSGIIFDKNIWDKMPPIARSDFSDAAKCLLVEASTPAAMVALRGMEAIVREYYRLKKGHDSGKKSLDKMIKELQKISNANIKLLGYIDYLRSEKRNLAQHPNKTFNQREAERIFMEIINAVYDIYSEVSD